MVQGECMYDYRISACRLVRTHGINFWDQFCKLFPEFSTCVNNHFRQFLILPTSLQLELSLNILESLVCNLIQLWSWWLILQYCGFGSMVTIFAKLQWRPWLAFSYSDILFLLLVELYLRSKLVIVVILPFLQRQIWLLFLTLFNIVATSSHLQV